MDRHNCDCSIRAILYPSAAKTASVPVVMGRAFSFSCLVGKAYHGEGFPKMGIVAA